MNKTRRILADGYMMSNNSHETGLNNNDLIIGTSGCGKTRGYVLPNILLGNESMIVADAKGYLRDEASRFLESSGYKVISIDFTDLKHSSHGYNPLDYISYDTETDKYSEQDILTVAACIVPITSAREPSWEMSARMYLESLIAYTLECLPEDEHNLCSVIQLFKELGNSPRAFEQLFRKLKQLNPESFAVSRYEMFKATAGADRTHACIVGTLAEKLSVLSFDGAKQLFENSTKVRFEDLGREKTAVFLTVSDTNDSMYRLANLFYTQALHCLCAYADAQPTHCLPVPVRFYLDDFASNVEIPNFDKIISIIRSREIYVSVILQSSSQLESIYGHAKAMTIINGCDHLLYIGGTDVETAQYIATKADKFVGTILNMPVNMMWLFCRGQKPKQVRRIWFDGVEEWLSEVREVKETDTVIER